MLCKIANLIVEVPEAGGLAPRCRDYLCTFDGVPDISIDPAHYRQEKRVLSPSEESFAYMESAYQFYLRLLDFDGFYLHSSAVTLDGMAYLFSGFSGVGKSTHTRLWQQTFGSGARVINDDKPALRPVDGRWYAYGTPWCGKDGINLNEAAPVAGVCFLKKASENRIRRLSRQEALQRILSQTIHKFDNVERLDRMLKHVDEFLKAVPVYELENKPEPEAALLSRETMLRGALEAFNEN